MYWCGIKFEIHTNKAYALSASSNRIVKWCNTIPVLRREKYSLFCPGDTEYYVPSSIRPKCKELRLCVCTTISYGNVGENSQTQRHHPHHSCSYVHLHISTMGDRFPPLVSVLAYLWNILPHEMCKVEVHSLKMRLWGRSERWGYPCLPLAHAAGGPP